MSSMQTLDQAVASQGLVVQQHFAKVHKPFAIESTILEESTFLARSAVALLLRFCLVNTKLLPVFLWPLIPLANQSVTFLLGQ